MRIAIAATAALLAGCAASAPPPVEPTASPSVEAARRMRQFEMRLVMRDRVQHRVGSEEEKVYGWSDYAGSTRLMGDEFGAELLVANDFVRGNGAFEGFLTLTSDKGTMGMRVTGVAGPGAQGDGSSYSGQTEIIGGTDRYDTLAGRGRFTGERTGPTGSPIDVRVTLDLVGQR